MRFTLASAIVALPFVVAAVPQPAKQGGTAIPLSKRLRSSLVNTDKSVNFEAVKSHVASTRAKILRGFDNFEKNTGASHPSAGKGPRKRAAVGNNLHEDNAIWSGTIDVGTPPDTYLVLFDTTSSDIVLPGRDCDSSCGGHHLYDPSSSVTSVDLDKTFEISFVERGFSVSGEQYSDIVWISELTAPGQTIGVASQYSTGLEVMNFPPDGLVGMAFQSISVYDASPVFQTFISAGQTDEPVFALSLAAPGPELYLGGTNPAVYTGDISYTPITQQGFWQINMDSIVGNGKTVLSVVPSIIDAGSEFVHGPSSDVASLYAAIGGTDATATYGKGYYTFPCDKIPSVRFIISGKSFSIPTDNLNIGPSKGDSSECLGSIIGDSDGDYWVIGNSFLSIVYTIFDVGNLRVGFATLA